MSAPGDGDLFHGGYTAAADGADWHLSFVLFTKTSVDGDRIDGWVMSRITAHGGPVPAVHAG